MDRPFQPSASTKEPHKLPAEGGDEKRKARKDAEEKQQHQITSQKLVGDTMVK
jgi:hypothetical protein